MAVQARSATHGSVTRASIVDAPRTGNGAAELTPRLDLVSSTAIAEKGPVVNQLERATSPYSGVYQGENTSSDPSTGASPAIGAPP